MSNDILVLRVFRRVDGGASFFENLPEAEPPAQSHAQPGTAGVSRTSTLSPRPGPAGGTDDGAGGGHHLGEAGESEAEIQRALFVGNYAAALDICLQVCLLRLFWHKFG